MKSEKPIFPQRKQLRAPWHNYAIRSAYFLTICTHQRQKIFGEIYPIYDGLSIVGATLRGRPHHPEKMIEKWLYEIEHKFPFVHLDKFVIMPDHIHLILFFSGDHIGSPLHRVVGWFKTMTTNEYIRHAKEYDYHPFQTALWQRNYMEHIIRDETDLIDIRNYISQNPLKQALQKT
jgi:REP element-mobilizing transposase RayT